MMYIYIVDLVLCIVYECFKNIMYTNVTDDKCATNKINIRSERDEHR